MRTPGAFSYTYQQWEEVFVYYVLNLPSKTANGKYLIEGVDMDYQNVVQAFHLKGKSLLLVNISFALFDVEYITN